MPLTTCSRLGTNLVVGDAKPGGWQPADDSGPGVARVRLFFHCVTFTDEKADTGKPKPDPALEEYVKNTVTGLEHAFPCQPREFMGGAKTAFHGTGIQFDVAGYDVVRVPKKVDQSGDYRACLQYGKKPGGINVYLVNKVTDHRGSSAACVWSGKRV